MTRSVDDYLALIPSYNSNKPKFTATIAASVAPLAGLQAALDALPLAFDLDAAIGAQLDAVGEWVGRSRRVPVPLEGLFFAFDDPVRGWDRGIWKGPYDAGTSISLLDDDTYRKLLRAKILANTWDGTTGGAQAVLDAYFQDPDSLVFVEDDGNCVLQNLYFSWDDAVRGWDVGVWTDGTVPPNNVATADPHFSVVVAGKQPSILDLALLGDDLIAIKPSTVRMTYEVASVDNSPAFGFDVQNQYIGGWDTGAWTVSPDYIITHPPIVEQPRTNTLPVFGFDAEDNLISGWDQGFWPLYDDIQIVDPSIPI